MLKGLWYPAGWFHRNKDAHFLVCLSAFLFPVKLLIQDTHNNSTYVNSHLEGYYDTSRLALSYLIMPILFTNICKVFCLFDRLDLKFHKIQPCEQLLRNA